MSYPDIVVLSAPLSDSRFFLEVDFLLSSGNLWRKIPFKSSYWNCSSKFLSFIWNFNLPTHEIFTLALLCDPLHLTCEPLYRRDSVLCICVFPVTRNRAWHKVNTLQMSDDKVLVLSIDMNLLKTCFSPSYLLFVPGFTPCTLNSLELWLLLVLAMKSCGRRQEGERRVRSGYIFACCTLPCGAPWIGCVPWPKVSVPLKVLFSMIFVSILVTSPSPHSYGVKNDNGSADPSQVECTVFMVPLHPSHTHVNRTCSKPPSHYPNLIAPFVYC